jgi:hypothetical protein
MIPPEWVKFEHTIFALPIALMGAWIAAAGFPDLVKIGRIHLAAMACRRPANPAPVAVLLARERNLARPWEWA